MAFLDLNLYGHASRVAFDPAKVIARARLAFPEATFLPGDQAAAEVERAERTLAPQLQSDPEGPAHQVLASLRRKACAYGPAYAFLIPQENGEPIQGLARSVNVQFLFTSPLAEATRCRLIDFLKSLGVGRLQASGPGPKQVETLADFQGESDCLLERAQVPWMDPSPPPAFEVRERV
jgi:hypothetical protein